jgi:hypothetical protein
VFKAKIIMIQAKNITWCWIGFDGHHVQEYFSSPVCVPLCNLRGRKNCNSLNGMNLTFINNQKYFHLAYFIIAKCILESFASVVTSFLTPSSFGDGC